MSSGRQVVFHSKSQLTALIRPPRANVLGVGIHALDKRSAVEFAEACIASGSRGYVCVTGVHGVMEAKRSAGFRKILDRALLVTPDGTPTVWVGKLQNHRRMGRVFGPDFMRDLCASSLKNGYTHFLYGGKPGIAEELRGNLEKWFPGIRVVGTFTPPFGPLNCQEQGELQETIARLAPDIIWVGLSTPKQELFMAQMIDRLNCRLMIGVGAAFDIHTGKLRDAPRWVKKAGLQWLHRVYQEPGRLWKRYLINNSAFLWHLAFQISGIRRYELSQESAPINPRLSRSLGTEYAMADSSLLLAAHNETENS